MDITKTRVVNQYHLTRYYCSKFFFYSVHEIVFLHIQQMLVCGIILPSCTSVISGVNDVTYDLSQEDALLFIRLSSI